MSLDAQEYSSIKHELLELAADDDLSRCASLCRSVAENRTYWGLLTDLAAELANMKYHSLSVTVRDCRVDLTDCNGLTPLHDAVLDMDVARAKHLIERGADINAPSSDGICPIHCVYQGGHTGNSIMELLLQHGADATRTEGEHGDTALHRIACFGDPRTAGLLLAAGADINARNKAGQTPLDMAEEEGNDELWHFLRERGARMGKPNH